MRTFFFLCLGLLATSVGCTTMQPINCPATIDVKNSALPPAGWQVIDPAGIHSLERIGFYSGPPSEQASLAPDRTLDGDGKSLDVWTFSPATEESLWAACFYIGTTLFIARPVRRDVRSCEASYKTTRSGVRMRVIEAHCE